MKTVIQNSEQSTVPKLPPFLGTGVDQITINPTAKDGKLRREDVSMLEVVFHNKSDIYYFAKDVQSRWISCNLASLILLNRSHINDVIGRSEADFFPPVIARAIRKDDCQVIKTGAPLVDRVELIVTPDGSLTWAETSKFRVINPNGDAIGLVGTTVVHADAVDLPQQFSYFKETIRFIRAHLHEPIRVGELAEKLNISESQFRRKFQAQFDKSPQAFILNLRLQSAINLLGQEDLPISQIGEACGFADQSYFTRQFKRFFGETPKAYRVRRRAYATGSHVLP